MKVLSSIVFLLAIFSFSAIGQKIAPVTWSFEQSEAAEDGSIDLSFKAEIKEGWVIYGIKANEDGPIPTSFEFDDTENFKINGLVNSSTKPTVSFDDLFEIELAKHKNEAVFIQSITPKSVPIKINGYLTYMTCNGRKCLPPTDVDFSFVIE